MFVGSIPADMQKILKELVSKWDCEDIYIGTSGNFTIERSIGDLGFGLHSNDVTLYSSVIGSYLAGDMIPFEFNEEFNESYGWLKNYINDPADRVATILLGTRLMETVGKEHKPYYARMAQAYKDQWPVIHAKTKEKVEKLQVRLKSYSASDVFTWVDDIPEDQGVICYPPFFGETADYEKYFAHLEELFLWKPPEYEFIYGDRLIEFFRKITSKKNWVFGTKEKLEEFEPYLKGMTKTTNRGVPIYVYTNGNTRRLVMPKQKTEPIMNPHIKPDQDLGEKLTIAPLTASQFFHIRSQYMNHNIKPGSPSLAFAVLVDGIIIGSFALMKAQTLTSFDTYIQTPNVYLLSDFPVANSKYKKLAKLVLYAALSKEVKLICERLERKRIYSLLTTAFTNRPVSMKYRGLFELLTRKENNKPNSSGEKFQLNYGALMGNWSLQEGYEIWKKKHGKDVGEGKNE
ncbi:hypothetical protein F7731_23625 [Cytobacillus depressus]|uniref:Uncharacterized protein n=1 Tax=Cytobacillus depressus TaxID=1602942 RepID=A0A6L3UZL8_9BACI|nr:hypothetical protein [Cytobacillus depressus]KAB2328946.1 hypothetical protein F7731_23625 [Cytobacillus depressus]